MTSGAFVASPTTAALFDFVEQGKGKVLDSSHPHVASSTGRMVSI